MSVILAISAAPQLEDMFGIKIEQVGINDCIYEKTCEGSCHSQLKIFDNEVYRVQTNTSSIIGRWRWCQGIPSVAAWTNAHYAFLRYGMTGNSGILWKLPAVVIHINSS